MLGSGPLWRSGHLRENIHRTSSGLSPVFASASRSSFLMFCSFVPIVLSYQEGRSQNKRRNSTLWPSSQMNHMGPFIDLHSSWVQSVMTHPGRQGGLGGSERVGVSDPMVLNPANDIACDGRSCRCPGCRRLLWCEMFSQRSPGGERLKHTGS